MQCIVCMCVCKTNESWYRTLAGYINSFVNYYTVNNTSKKTGVFIENNLVQVKKHIEHSHNWYARKLATRLFFCFVLFMLFNIPIGPIHMVFLYMTFYDENLSTNHIFDPVLSCSSSPLVSKLGGTWTSNSWATHHKLVVHFVVVVFNKKTAYCVSEQKKSFVHEYRLPLIRLHLIRSVLRRSSTAYWVY